MPECKLLSKTNLENEVQVKTGMAADREIVLPTERRCQETNEPEIQASFVQLCGYLWLRIYVAAPAFIPDHRKLETFSDIRQRTSFSRTRQVQGCLVTFC